MVCHLYHFNFFIHIHHRTKNKKRTQQQTSSRNQVNQKVTHASITFYKDIAFKVAAASTWACGRALQRLFYSFHLIVLRLLADWLIILLFKKQIRISWCSLHFSVMSTNQNVCAQSLKFSSSVKNLDLKYLYRPTPSGGCTLCSNRIKTI